MTEQMIADVKQWIVRSGKADYRAFANAVTC